MCEHECEECLHCREQLLQRRERDLESIFEQGGSK